MFDNTSFKQLSLALTALLASSFTSQVTLAQEDTLQEVVVTATRTTTSPRESITALTVIDGDTVQLGQPQLGLDEALNRVPGLFLQNRFNFAQDLRISNRGFGARASFGIRGIRILVDGIPATLADGQGSVDLIDLGSIERIEVLRGPASALFGNAAGGVIAIESEVGSEQPYIEARAAIGEYGYDKTQIKSAGTQGNFGYLASIAHVDVDGFRDYSQAQNTVINLKGRYHINGEQGDTKVDVALSHTDQPEANDPGGINRDLASSTPRAARDRNVQLGAGENLNESRLGSRLTHRNLWRPDDLVTLNAHVGQRDFAGFIPTGDGGIVFDRTFAGGGLQYETQLIASGYTHEFVTGIELETQDDDRERYQNLNGQRGNLLLNQNEKVDNIGVYLQDSIALNAATRLVLGVRYDSITFEINDQFLGNGDASAKRTLTQTSPVIGLNWSPSDNFSAYVNRATSFESPTTTELALAAGGFNTALEPQIATSYEVGTQGRFNYFPVPVSYSLALYSLALEDELIPIEQADGSDVFFNAGKSSRRGFELDTTASFTDRWSAHLAYTFSDFEFDEFVDGSGNNFAGSRTPGTPEHAATLSLDYRSALGFASLDLEHVGEIILNNANTESSPSHVLVSVRAGFSQDFGPWRLSPFVGIQNLGDTRYFSNTRTNAFGGRFFEPGPGRNAYGGVTVRYVLNRH